MLFFRSEERVREWCAARRSPAGPLVRMDQLWGLALAWFSARLHPTWRRARPDEMRAIFTGVGLTEAFWDPEFRA